MIVWLSHKIYYFVLKHGNINEEMSEIIQYGIEITLSSICNILLIFFCGVFLGDVLSGIIFLIIFVSLRQYTGGYHASSYLNCNLLFLTIFVSVYGLSRLSVLFHGEEYLIAFYFLAAIPIVIFAPIEHENKPISAKLERKCSITAWSIYVIIGLVYFLVKQWSQVHAAVMIFSLVAVSMLILMAAFQKRKNSSMPEK